MITSLEGLNIVSFSKIHDYMQIFFLDGTILTINCNIKCTRGSSNRKSIENSWLVLRARESNEIVTIELSDNTIVEIFLGEVAANVPEKMVLRRAGKDPVVWN